MKSDADQDWVEQMVEAVKNGVALDLAEGVPDEEVFPPGITATAARVPVDLYEAAVPLVKGVGRPSWSWGQKVAWTCQNHRQEVVEATVAILRPVVGVLIPRGQNKQAQATTQVTARFTADEYVVFSSVLDEVRAAAAAAGLTTPVTATALVIAALEVAGRHPA